MSSSVEVPIAKLLPTAGTWAAPFTLYSLLLGSRIVSQRLKTKHFIGENPADASSTKPSPLAIAVRCHDNFLENVPLAFILLIIAELNGGNRKGLHYTMGTLFALRIAHAEFGLTREGNFGDNAVGRPIGYFGTVGVLAGLAGYVAKLVGGGGWAL